MNNIIQIWGDEVETEFVDVIIIKNDPVEPQNKPELFEKYLDLELEIAIKL